MTFCRAVPIVVAAVVPLGLPNLTPWLPIYKSNLYGLKLVVFTMVVGLSV